MSLISVIVPCYNQGEFLIESVQSIKTQTYQDWECIIVNDGSTDDTDRIARELMKSDSRIKYLHKTNGGLSSARNAGLQFALGTYVQFLDADDFIQPEKFAVQLAALAGKPKGTIAVCDHFPFDDVTKEFVPRCYMSPFLDERDYKKEIIRDWEFRKSIPCHNLLIPKNLINTFQLRFYENLANHEDWVFWCEMFYYSTGVVYQFNKLASYRMRPNSMTTNKAAMAEGFLAATFILETFYRDKREPEYVKLVMRMRKEIRNNLFAYGRGKKIYSVIVREVKQLLGVHLSN